MQRKDAKGPSGLPRGTTVKYPRQEPCSPGIEDAINRIWPVFPAQNRVAGMAGEDGDISTSALLQLLPESMNPAMKPGYYQIQEGHSFHDVVLCTWLSGCLHVKQGHQEGERRFRSLVFIYAIWMKSVLASACCRVVERHLQVVLAEKPPEYTMGFFAPLALLVSLYASRQAEIVAQASTGC